MSNINEKRQIITNLHSNYYFKVSNPNTSHMTVEIKPFSLNDNNILKDIPLYNGRGENAKIVYDKMICNYVTLLVIYLNLHRIEKEEILSLENLYYNFSNVKQYVDDLKNNYKFTTTRRVPVIFPNVVFPKS